MRFLIDANVRKAVGLILQEQGHDVRFIAGTEDHSSTDQEVLQIAEHEERIIITNDKDFGHLVFFGRLEHRGVILMRLGDESRDNYINRIRSIIEVYGERLESHFLVVTDFHERLR